MVNFELYSPVRVFFGAGERKRIGEVAKTVTNAKTALIVSYAQHDFFKHVLDGVQKSLTDNDIKVITCYNVTANPMISQIKHGIKLCRENSVDVIIGVGGGSAMDTAKAIGVGVYYDGDVWDFYYSKGSEQPKALPDKSVPTIMMPTLPATSSEMNNIAVATNDDTTEKSHICGNILYPTASVIDPELTCTLPAYQTACGAVDAISHICEAYFNCEPDTPFQDRLQEGAVKTIMELLPKILKDPFNASLRASMQWTSALCWNGWLHAGVAPRSPMHPIGHVLSARYGVTHGASLGIVMPSFFRYVVDRRLDRFAQFGRRIFDLSGTDKEVAYKAIDLFEKFIAENGVQTKLSQCNIPESEISVIADDVRRINCDKDGFLPSNPPVNKEDIEKILRLAL